MAPKIIIAGGGTGGHIFPAVAIASELKRRDAATEILFVGAKSGMEMSVVPKQGYDIKGVWISGIQRQLNLRNIGRNLLFPVKLLVSLSQSNNILRAFKPDLVVGVGGYASGPMGRAAASNDIPLVLCEQNAYPGLVNKWLAKKASKILLGNAAAQKYFDPGKTQVTGNPIRAFDNMSRSDAAQKMGLAPDKPIVVSMGGSLGALKINQVLETHIHQALEAGIQWVWQCGKYYYETLSQRVATHENLRLTAFIDDMSAAYHAADLVIGRAGGSTISELIALSKPAILVPSPNVAEDHQTQNARSLSDHGAALLITDAEAMEKLVPKAIRLIQDEHALSNVQTAISNMPKYEAAKVIVDELHTLLNIQPSPTT
ncbi:MAG: undecaprenyldiphospho-muramoylpentapeptide beta-N-acetylglucosaminyltransferase [Bacteroidota bacterium]